MFNQCGYSVTPIRVRYWQRALSIERRVGKCALEAYYSGTTYWSLELVSLKPVVIWHSTISYKPQATSHLYSCWFNTTTLCDQCIHAQFVGLMLGLGAFVHFVRAQLEFNTAFVDLGDDMNAAIS